jgi:hypothetical protein
MSMKNATPSGSQRSRICAPDLSGRFTRVPHDTWERAVAALPKPLTPEDAAVDFGYLAECATHLGHEMPSAAALGRRWGWSQMQAKRAAAALRSPGAPMPSRTGAPVVPRSCPGDAPVVPRSDGENADAIASDCPGAAPVVPRSCPGAAPVLGENDDVEAAEVAPKKQELKKQEEQEQDAPAKAKKRPRKAKPEALSDEAAQALLDRMHAIAAQVEPRTRKPALGEVVKPMRYCAGELVALAQETGRTPEGIIEAAWLWFWTNPDPWHRTNLRGLRGYAAVLRPDNATSYAGRQADIEAAKAPPAPQTLAAPVRDAADDAWDVWVSGIEEARAWVAARRGSREAAAFTEAMERAVHPNPIAEFYGALAGKRDRAMARDIFTREFRARTALRLVSK